MNKSNLISRKLITAITITGITITALGIGQGSFANETNQVDYVAVQEATNQDRVQVVDKTEAIIKGKQERVAPFVAAVGAAFVLGAVGGAGAKLGEKYLVPLIEDSVTNVGNFFNSVFGG